MGYESKIILGLTSDKEHLPGEGRYVRTVAMVDLSKTGDGPVFTLLREAVRVARETNEPFYVYVDDADKGASEDPYGDPVAEVDAAELLAALEADDPTYRRFALARHMVAGWIAAQPAYLEPAAPGTEWYERPVVLHYGH